MLITKLYFHCTIVLIKKCLVKSNLISQSIMYGNESQLNILKSYLLLGKNRQFTFCKANTPPRAIPIRYRLKLIC